MSIRGAGRNFVVRYALEQIVRFVALMFAVSFVVFALVSASPIDPVQMNVGQAAYMTMSEAKRAQLAQYWGVGTPLLERYANWLAAVLQGDWGTSLRFNAPVMEGLGNRAANSLALLGIAWVASGVLGLLLGMVAGVNRDRWPDRLVKGYCFVVARACGPHGIFGVAWLVPSGLFGAARKIGGRCDAARHRSPYRAACNRAFIRGRGEHRVAYAREARRYS